MWSPWFSTNNTARLQTLFKRLIGCCLSWEAISEVSVTAEKVRKQGKEETIVTVSNRLLQLNWDSCGFQAPLSITAKCINGLNLNDKTISHEQPISLSTGWGSWCVERFHCSHMEFGFRLKLVASSLNHDRMCNHQMSSSQSLLQLAAQCCH